MLNLKTSVQIITRGCQIIKPYCSKKTCKWTISDDLSEKYILKLIKYTKKKKIIINNFMKNQVSSGS